MSPRDHKTDKEDHPFLTCFHRWARFWPFHSPSRPFRLSVPWKTQLLSSSWPMGKHHLPRNGEINWMLKISEKKVYLLVYLIKSVLNSPRANSPKKNPKHNYLSAQHLVSGEMGTFTYYFKIPEWTTSYSSGNQKYKYVSSLERTASQWSTTFHQLWFLHIFEMVSPHSGAVLRHGGEFESWPSPLLCVSLQVLPVRVLQFPPTA